MTADYVVRLAPMLVLAGLSVAWLAQLSGRTRAYGFLPDVGLGLVGSLAGGLVAWAALSPETGMLVTLGIGTVGAMAAMAAQRGMWHAAPVRS